MKKLISFLNSYFKENLINNNLFKTKVSFLLSKNLNPAEFFSFEYAFNNILNINYKIAYEEDLLKEKNEIICWEDYITFNQKVFSIYDKQSIKKNLKNKDYVIIGDSTKWEQNKMELERIIKNKILEYENSKTILFERV